MICTANQMTGLFMKFNNGLKALLENRLSFLMKMKDSAFLFKIIFLKKRTAQLYKIIKESFHLKIKKSKICFW